MPKHPSQMLFSAMPDCKGRTQIILNLKLSRFNEFNEHLYQTLNQTCPSVALQTRLEAIRCSAGSLSAKWENKCDLKIGLKTWFGLGLLSRNHFTSFIYSNVNPERHLFFYELKQPRVIVEVQNTWWLHLIDRNILTFVLYFCSKLFSS